MRTIYDNSQRATTWVVGVVRLVSTDNSRTRRLHILLTASDICLLLYRSCISYQAIIDVCGLSKEIDATLE